MLESLPSVILSAKLCKSLPDPPCDQGLGLDQPVRLLLACALTRLVELPLYNSIELSVGHSFVVGLVYQRCQQRGGLLWLLRLIFQEVRHHVRNH